MDNNLEKKKSIKRKIFSKEEDLLLLRAIKLIPSKNWKEISKLVPTRTPRQCRERWYYHLGCLNSNEKWSNEEEELLIKLIEQYGKKWSIIKKKFPNRNYTSIKNHWNLYLSKNDNKITEIDNQEDVSINIKWVKLEEEEYICL